MILIFVVVVLFQKCKVVDYEKLFNKLNINGKP